VQILHVDSSAFIPNQDVAYDISNGDLRAANSSSVFQATAAVQLPQGATIVAVNAVVFDTDPGLATTIELVRNGTGTGALEQMALATSPSDVGVQSLADTSIANAVVDNVGFTYRLQTFSISAITRLLDASILYTLP
jgi:hypothetical protein